jgi:hypothetical protein
MQRRSSLAARGGRVDDCVSYEIAGPHGSRRRRWRLLTMRVPDFPREKVLILRSPPSAGVSKDGRKELCPLPESVGRKPFKSVEHNSSSACPPQVAARITAATHQPDGQIIKTLSSLSRKNIPLPSSGKSALSARPVSRGKRGGSRSSRTLRWDAVDAGFGDRRTPERADGEVVWS